MAVDRSNSISVAHPPDQPDQFRERQMRDYFSECERATERAPSPLADVLV